MELITLLLIVIIYQQAKIIRKLPWTNCSQPRTKQVSGVHQSSLQLRAQPPVGSPSNPKVVTPEEYRRMVGLK